MPYRLHHRDAAVSHDDSVPHTRPDFRSFRPKFYRLFLRVSTKFIFLGTSPLFGVDAVETLDQCHARGALFSANTCLAQGLLPILDTQNLGQGIAVRL